MGLLERLGTRSDVAACVAMVGILGGCWAGQQRGGDCSEARLAEIEASYIAEVFAACNGQHLDACEAYPPLRDKYDSIREEWIQCK